MKDYNLTHEATSALDKILIAYKEAIIEKASASCSQEKITAEDIIQASRNIDKIHDVNNEAIRYNIKKQRITLIALSISMLYLLIGVVFITFENTSIFYDLNDVNTYIIIAVSLGISTISIILFLTLRVQKNRMPDKQQQIFKFLNSWNNFERILQHEYRKKAPNKEPSFIEIMDMLLSSTDDKYINKANDFNYVLKLRNRIIHEQNLNQISINEIIQANEILEKLQQSIKN